MTLRLAGSATRSADEAQSPVVEIHVKNNSIIGKLKLKSHYRVHLEKLLELHLKRGEHFHWQFVFTREPFQSRSLTFFLRLTGSSSLN